jgi:WD40 repeat protein
MIYGAQARGCPISQLAFAPDGATLAGLTLWRGVTVWNLPDGTIRKRWQNATRGGLHAALAPDGTRLYFSESNWVQNPRLEVLALPDFTTEGSGAATGAIAYLFAAGVPGRFAVYRRIGDYNSGYELVEYQLQGKDKLDLRWRQNATDWYLRTLAYFPNGGPLVCGEYVREGSGTRYRLRGTLRDADTGEVRGIFALPKASDFRLIASPNGKQVVMSNASHLLAWPDVELPDAPVRVPSDNRKHFTGFAFHPSGKYLAVTSNDTTVKLYDTTTWEVARSFTWDIGKMLSVTFNADGTLAAAGSDKGKIVVWDVDL